jgi:CHASE2 domain-containing sensor protein
MGVTLARHRSANLSRKLGRYLETLRRRSLTNWLVALMLVIVGTCLSVYLEDNDYGLGMRYSLYQFLQYLSPNKPHAKRTTLVMIGDDEFWGPELAGRRPIRRDYLGKLLLAIEAVDPELIALDFKLIPASGTGGQESPAQRAEDQILLSAIDQVSSRSCPIILPATLDETKLEADIYTLGPSIYSQHVFPPAVGIGYIDRIRDVRQVPVGLHLSTGERQDSFAEAIVRRVDPKALANLEDENSLPFATFIQPAMFTQLPARLVLATPSSDLRSRLRSKIVIVSASWNPDRSRLSERVDTHETPVGKTPGAIVQANYVEALLDSRVLGCLNRPLAVALEIALAAVIALLFALTHRSWTKLLTVAGVCAAAVLIGYVLLQNFGRYFDFYLPIVLLAGHATVERVREWWSDSLELKRKEHADEQRA